MYQVGTLWRTNERSRGKNSIMNEHIENIIDRHLNRNKMISKMWPGLQIAMVEKKTIAWLTLVRENFSMWNYTKISSSVNRTNQGCDHTAFVWMQAEDLQLDSKFWSNLTLAFQNSECFDFPSIPQLF